MSPAWNAEAERLERQLEELRQEQARLGAAISANRQALRDLSAQIKTAEINLAHLKGATSTSSGTVADAAEACLRRSGRPMRVIDMVPLLQREGKLLRSESAYSTLFRTLTRYGNRFKHVSGRRGYWALVSDP